MKARLVIDGNLIHDIASFYQEINRVFMPGEDWKIAQSLDAFDDLLYGGFGALRGAEETEIVWLNIDKSKEALGYQVTRDYYKSKLKPGSGFNKSLFEQKLDDLESGVGQTYFEILVSILASHPNLTILTTKNNRGSIDPIRLKK